MAFNWQQNINPGASIDAADLNEIKTNLDSIYSYLGLTRTGCASGAGWSSIWPIQGNYTVPIQASHFLELRNVIDYAWDRWCRTHYSSHCSSFESTYNGWVDSPDYDTQNSTNNSSVCPANDSTYRFSHNITVG